MKEWIGSNKKGFLASLLLHGLLLSFLLFSIDNSIGPSPTMPQVPSQPVEIVKAVVVDSKEVDMAVAQLQAEEQKRKLAEEERVKVNQQKVELAKQEKERVMADLEKAKHSMSKLKEVTKTEEADLAKIKLQKEKEQQELADLKAKREKEKKDLAKVEERRAEQQRLKENQEIKDREEKKRTEKQQLAENTRKEKEKQEKLAKAGKEKSAAERYAKLETEAHRYLSAWGSKVKLNKRIMPDLPAETQTDVGAKILPDGSVRPRVVRSSGNAVFDDWNLKAVLKTPFEFPEDPSIKEKVKEIIAKEDLVLEMDNGR